MHKIYCKEVAFNKTRESEENCRKHYKKCVRKDCLAQVNPDLGKHIKTYELEIDVLEDKGYVGQECKGANHQLCKNCNINKN